MTATLPAPTTPEPPGRRAAAPPTPRPARQAVPPAPGNNPSGAEWALISTTGSMLALVCLWVVGQLLFLSTFSEQRAQDLLYNTFRTDVASATAPVGPGSDSGTAVALLTVPRLGISQVVVEGTSPADTQDGPGHLRRTVLPGQVGASVVMGRATTYGAPFRDVDQLRPGDKIDVAMSQGTVTYQVIDVRRAGDEFPQPLESGHARLTLETAEGHGALAALMPDGVVYVDAEATKAFVPPSGLPSTVPDSEQVMGSDRGALPLLVLYLALLVALTLGVVVARQRWSAPLVWVVTTPVALALAWATTDVAVRLLPNVV